MSLKDRIAMFNKKPEESSKIVSTEDSTGNTRRPSVTHCVNILRTEGNPTLTSNCTPEKNQKSEDSSEITNNNTPSSSAKPSRRLSVSDRIASLKNEGTLTPASPADHGDDNKSEQPRKTLIADRIAAMKNTPIHKPSEADKYLSPNNKSPMESSEPRSPPALPVRLMPEAETVEGSKEPALPTPPPANKLTIAERIAAMKANAAAKPESTIVETQSSSAPGETRKLNGNLKDLGAKIILPGLGGPRPMFPSKPPITSSSNVEIESSIGSSGHQSSSSVDENGEFHHVSYTSIFLSLSIIT